MEKNTKYNEAFSEYFAKKYYAKIREYNKELFARCRMCGKPSETIESDGYKIYPVCKNHIRED